MSDVVLYDYWRSSASYRVRIALNMAGISYTTVPVNLLEAEHKRPEYLVVNPQGLVPALMIDGMVMNQSLSIIEYLAEIRPGSGLLPDDLAGRQRVRALAQAVAVDIHPVCNMHVASYVISLTANEDSRREWMKHFIEEGLGKLEAMLSDDAAFCFGNEPTMADLCLVPQIYNANRWGADLTGFRRIIAINAKCSKLPEFEAAHPDCIRQSGGKD